MLLLKKLALLLLVMLTTSCTTVSPVINSGCLVFKPIYLSKSEIPQMTVESKKQILAHNLVYEKICFDGSGTINPYKTQPLKQPE
ncbi:Rz-like spanin [Proteus phage Myduc]|uniref:Putative o-spanin n=1 Tax=Proteus phage Myduc TaxID=2650874 RepID=A0A5J6T7L7_9CAUD|nr:Rz-like spanin [Proteus phage Myduc]QFG06657.1 putative o-spanin [Proteus phage Myduc]